MFEKPTFLSLNQETDARYLTLSGYPVYVHEEPNLLKAAFRRAADFIKLPEIHYPLMAFAAATIIDSGSTPNFDFLLSGSVVISLAGGFTMKYYEALMHIPTDLSPLNVFNPFSLRKPYYFDKEPEGVMKSEKPQRCGPLNTLKTRSSANMILNAAGGSLMASIPLLEKDISFSMVALSSVFAAPLLTNAYRHAQVVMGKWDLTDEPPKPKKKPEVAPASVDMAYTPI